MKLRILTLLSFVLLLHSINVFSQDDDYSNNNERRGRRRSFNNENNSSMRQRRAARFKRFQENDGRRSKQRNLDRFPKLKKMLESMSEEEQAELKKLHREDPQKFRQEMRKRIKAWKKEQGKKGKQNKTIKNLQKAYFKADSQQKDTILKKLQKATEEEFDSKMENNRKKIEHLEQRVQQLREKYEERQSNRSEIIEKRIKSLTSEKNLNW